MTNQYVNVAPGQPYFLIYEEKGRYWADEYLEVVERACRYNNGTDNISLTVVEQLKEQLKNNPLWKAWWGTGVFVFKIGPLSHTQAMYVVYKIESCEFSYGDS